MVNKAYQSIQIVECNEPLVVIPLEKFAVETPHPYEKLGADYQGKSPYYLRQEVLTNLTKAQLQLQTIQPGWRIKIFDAFRPVQVQAFMVNYTFTQQIKTQGLNLDKLSSLEQECLWLEVYQLWAQPSLNPQTPPPHSTGAAIDITLVDARGKTIDMGGEIDEMSPRSQPDYYANKISELEEKYHLNRQLLKQIMLDNHFVQHPAEWWHFSLGDQMWAWQLNQKNPNNNYVAKYGRFFN
ncbi:MAG: D-alanyl-D-alanine dipeptidase [Cyanobacteria bacterium J149]|nr:MAG: D-alanyl-D-alanine dipeptidase [Cyanobacteria bacterium J149]